MHLTAIRQAVRLAFSRVFFSLAGIAALSACGGGGSNTPNTPSSQPPPQILSPAVSGHLARFNEFRSCAKLGALSFNNKLAVAAQAHADYLKANNEFTHGETPGAPGFYGAGITDRVEKAGYSVAIGTLQSETLAGGAATTEQQGRDLADLLLGSPAHRFTILAPDFTEVGISTAPLVSVFATPKLQGGNPVVMFPCEGLTGVNVLTPVDKAPFAVDETAVGARPGVVGYPLSLSGRIFSTFNFRSPWLRAADGSTVALKCANPETDPVPAVLCAPAAPLQANASYQWGVDIQAGVGVWNAYSARFTTGPN